MFLKILIVFVAFFTGLSLGGILSALDVNDNEFVLKWLILFSVFLIATVIMILIL